MTPWEGKVPFDKHGALMSYVSGWAGGVDFREIKWEDNTPRQLELEFTKTQRGRSSAVFIALDSEGVQYRFFMTAVLELMVNSSISMGKVSGLFAVVKKGTDYGWALFEPAPTKKTKAAKS